MRCRMGSALPGGGQIVDIVLVRDILERNERFQRLKPTMIIIAGIIERAGTLQFR